MERRYDVFISHAGEDKDSLAMPIYKDLRRRGVRVFLDRPELRVGGDATEEMVHAMKTALIGLFILSPEFAAKVWTMRELICFEERTNGEGGSGAACPVLIPIFYRLTVAETRYRLVFKKYPEVCARHGFMERLDKGEVVMSRVLDALVALSRRTGIECDKGVSSNEGSINVSESRRKLVQRICDEVVRVLEDKFQAERISCESSEVAASNMFRPAFYAPENAHEVSLDFSRVLTDCVPRSHEAQVLHEVLRAGDEDESTKIVVVKGSAGVGKSCILRGIARDEEVKRRFPGGAYFLSLGMDATVETLISELLKVARMSGGHETARKLKDEKSLDVVLEGVGRWMKGKRSLMLLDDLWDRRKLGAAIIPRVAGVLSAESGSALIVTTRFSSVSITGTVVEVAPRDPMSKEAKNILLRYAGFTIEEVMTNRVIEDILEKLLRICGGLPVCLAAMGRGLKELALALRSRGVEVWVRYHKMVEEGEKLIHAEVGEYGDLRTTLSVSLKVLEERRGRYEEMGGILSWAEMHRSFCIMRKQAAVSVQVFARVWGLSSQYEALDVVQAFSGVGLASIETGSDEATTYVRLHDLIHDFSAVCAKSNGEHSEWHKRVLDSYIRRVPPESESAVREWWNVDDDDYIYEHLCWHLGKSGNTEELIELLLNGRWTKVRLERGGLLWWMKDFEECSESISASRNYSLKEKERLQKELKAVRDAVVESWSFLGTNARELGFQVYGRLQDIKEGAAHKYVGSIRDAQEKPCAIPLRRCWNQPGYAGRGGEFVLNFPFVEDIAIDEEGHTAVVGIGTDIVVIDLREMRKVRTCTGRRKIVKGVALSGDGSRTFSWSQKGMVQGWNVETGDQVRCVTLKDDGDNGSDVSWFSCAAICADLNIAVTGTRGVIRFWDLQSGKERSKAIHCSGFVRFVSVSRNGRRIVAAEGRRLHIWDMFTLAEVGSVLAGHEGDVTCATFSADGRLIASGSDDRTIRIWDVDSGTQRGESFRGHEGPVRCVSISEDGRLIVSGGLDGTVRLWDAATRVQVGRSLRACTSSVWCLSMTRDARFVMCGGDSDTVRVWDLEAALGDAEGQFEDEIHVRCLDVSPDGKYFVSGSDDGTVRLWEGSTGKQIRDGFHVQGEGVTCVAVSPCGQRFVSGSVSGALCVWDLETCTRVGKLLFGHTDWVRCATYSPNGTIIISGSEDRTIRLWSTVTHTQVGLAIGRGTIGMVEQSPSVLRAVSSRLAGCFRPTTTPSEGSDHRYVNHTVGVSCVMMSNDGEKIVSGLWSGSLHVWDARSRKLIGARRCDHSGEIVRLEEAGENEIRSLDDCNTEMTWRLDDQQGLVRLAGCNDDVQGADETSLGEYKRKRDVICLGREVFLRGADVKLATLPTSVKKGQWRFSESSGALGVILEDNRLLFLRVEQ